MCLSQELMWRDSLIILWLLSSFPEQRCTLHAGSWYLPRRGNREIFVSGVTYPNSSQSTKWQTWPSLGASEENSCLHKRHMKLSWLLKEDFSKKRVWNKSFGKMFRSHCIVGNEVQHLCPVWAINWWEQQVPSFGHAVNVTGGGLCRGSQEMLMTLSRPVRGKERPLRSWNGENSSEFC